MNRRTFLTALNAVPFLFKSGNKFNNLNALNFSPSMIFLVKGATGAVATGIPAIAEHIKSHVSYCSEPFFAQAREQTLDEFMNNSKTASGPVYDYGWFSWMQIMVINHNEFGIIKNWLNNPPGTEFANSNSTIRHLIIIGHSLGAYEAVNFCQQIYPRKVSLLVTLDPYSPANVGQMPQVVSANVSRAVNFYTNNAAPGNVHGQELMGTNKTTLQNKDFTDFRCNNPACKLGLNHTYTHTSIDDCITVHKQIALLMPGGNYYE